MLKNRSKWKLLLELLTQSAGVEFVRVQEIPDERLSVVNFGQDIRQDEDPRF